MYPYIFDKPETSKRFGLSTLYDQGRKMKEVRGPKKIGFLIASRLSIRKTILSCINLANIEQDTSILTYSDLSY